jgi:hypothetical protein
METRFSPESLIGFHLNSRSYVLEDINFHPFPYSTKINNSNTEDIQYRILMLNAAIDPLEKNADFVQVIFLWNEKLQHDEHGI